MASDSAVEATNGVARQPLRFADLPGELQQEIVSHVPQHDLICLCLVSRRFRDLAAAELYRSFNIIFPDDDDPAYDSPVDGLANGLETFATSDYDYAKHLRDVSLDTVSAGDKAELSYKHYLASQSCGKFMNTLILLMLRKANALEKLRWNIRVELSRPVYKALHQIDTLRHLHIRLQAGPSIYEPPPPLPLFPFSNTPSLVGSAVGGPLLTGHGPYHHLPPPFYIAPPSSMLPPPPPPPPKPAKAKAPKKPAISANPPTLSGFKNLKTLSVLDIDDLEVITELKSCIRNSQGTLNKLKLSFSTSLASRARKPPPEIDPNDSDPDDEFQVVPVSVPPPLPSYDDIGGPAKAFRAQEERKTQEAVLGRIFDVEPYLVKQPAKRTRVKETETTKAEKTGSPGTDFMDSLRAVSHKLMRDLNGGSDDWTATQQEVLDAIETASRKYLGEEEIQKDIPKANETNGESSGAASNVPKDTAEASSAAHEPKAESSLFGQKSPKGKDTEQQSSNPDDIDIEAPVEDGFFEDLIDLGTSEPVNGTEAVASKAPKTELTQSPSKGNDVVVPAEDEKTVIPDSPDNVSAANATLHAQHENFKMLAEKLHHYEIQAAELQKDVDSLIDPRAGIDAMKRVVAAETQIQEFSATIREVRHEMSIVAAEIEDAEKQRPDAVRTTDQEAMRRRIGEYMRSTRGLSMQTLSIHLIPVKASVLSRAINLRALRSVTLLNVGNQAPIWALFAKENKIEPLALRRIFTDNVSVVFLNFVSQLPEVHELFMLERSEKFKPESFAPKSTVTVDQIRRLVLKKHIGSLKSLMIKNQQDTSWDVDTKATTLICRRGNCLEELAVSMSISGIHTMLQHIQLLKNLRALHIINLRNDDTCVWVMRETKKFVIDTLSHFPELKLEWLAIDEDEHVERIVRWKAPPKEKKSFKGKGKEKANSSAAIFTNGDQYPVLSLENTANYISDTDEDDVSTAYFGDSATIETIENIHFYDVLGVKIFKREIATGRL